MPGRKFNSGDYRFGFNGKENDSEWGSQVIQDYGFRIYNPSIGKFLSVDPLTKSYPMLTPYQFASNRPIDGIDLDGLEYVTYVVNWYEGQSKPQINISVFDPSDNRNYGAMGEGVLYVTNHWKTEDSGFSKLVSSEKKFYERETGFFQYGLYYGAKGLFQISRDGSFSDENDYSIPAIDAVDYAAWHHDQAYGAVGAAGKRGLTKDHATIPADLAAINDWEAIVEIGEGGVDPFNYQTITSKQITAAKRGIKGFEHFNNNKIMEAVEFIARQVGTLDGAKSEGSDNWISDNYSIFVNTYFEKEENDMYYKKRNGYWEQNENGDFESGGDPIPVDNIEN